MATFRKGALGSPWSKEVQGSEAMDPGDAQNGDEWGGPRVGPGKFAKSVTPEVSRNGKKAAD